MGDTNCKYNTIFIKGWKRMCSQAHTITWMRIFVQNKTGKFQWGNTMINHQKIPKASKNVTADGISVNHAAGVKEDRVSALCELCNRLQWLICFSRDRKKN